MRLILILVCTFAVSACSLSGLPPGEPTRRPVDGIVQDQKSTTECPDLSGHFVSTSNEGNLTERTVTQTRCDELKIEGVIHLTVNGKEVLVHSDDTYAADSVCRIYTETNADTEACSAHWFTKLSFVTEVVNKKTPGVDHEFRSGLFTISVEKSGNLVEEFLFLGPSGEELQRESRSWAKL